MRTAKRHTTGLVLGIAIALMAAGVAIAAEGLATRGSPEAESVEVELVGRWPFGPAFAVASAEIGGTPYVLLGSGGALLVLDITEPADPILVSSVATPGVVRGLAITGDLVLVANDEAGLRVVDIGDPFNPFEVGFYGGDPEGVAVKDDLALVAYGLAGLRIIDISDPANPFQVGFYNTPSHAFDVAVKGDLALVADDFLGLRVIDISDPSSPVEVAFFDTPSDAFGVAVKDDLALVAARSAGLRAIDISDPTNPVEVGFYDTPGNAYGVAVKDDLALVAARSAGLRAIDISDPTNPVEVGFYDTPGNAYGVAVKDDLVLVADSDGGLIMLCVAPQIPIPGDADGNCIVNFGDMKVVASALGTSNPEADLNDDGIVNILDVALVGANLQR